MDREADHFRYIAEPSTSLSIHYNGHLCPAGEQLIYHYTNEEDGRALRRCWIKLGWNGDLVVFSPFEENRRQYGIIKFSPNLCPVRLIAQPRVLLHKRRGPDPGLDIVPAYDFGAFPQNKSDGFTERPMFRAAPMIEVSPRVGLIEEIRVLLALHTEQN